MLLSNEARDVGKSGVLESAKATIKTSPKIFNFFADQTYANKPRAICRELVANAVDSHVMAGKPQEPVEVWLPTLIDPVFKVRDFGLGMAHEFMMTNFMQYADGSTKDNSNIAIGGFGIGSKSPFAYVDQYTVKSTFDGTVSVYTVFKDEDGIPSIALLAQKSTDECNGVEVSFPVEPSDFDTFRVAAFEALRYFDPLPLIRNAGSHKFEATDYAAQGKGWGMRRTSGPLQVVMGGVMYPVDANNLTYKFKDETARKMLNYGLDIFVPIGTCSIALSREQLSYDERTIEGLTKACLGVVDEVAKSFSTMFDHYPSLWDAKTALQEEVTPTGRTYGVSVRGEFLAQHALYQGQKLELNHTFFIPGGMTLWDLDPASYRRGNNKTPNPKWEHYASQHVTLTPGKFEMVIIDDLGASPKHRVVARIKEFLSVQPQAKRILVVRPFDEATKASVVLKALGNPSVYTLVSSLPEPQAGTIMAGSKAPRPRVRMFTYNGHKGAYSWNGSRYYETLNPGAYGRKGIEEIAYADQPDSGILVKMETWKPQVDRFHPKMELGIINWNEIHFVNAGDYKKLDKAKWKDFETVFQERLAQKLKSIKGLGEMLAVEQHFDHEMRRAMALDLSGAPKKHPFVALKKIFEDYVNPIKTEDRKYGPFVTVALPKGVDPVKLWGDFKKTSPRAFRLLQLTSYQPTGSDHKWFIEELK
jgi:hypothetical protein